MNDVRTFPAREPVDLDAIRQRCDAAQPGPWTAYETIHGDNFIVGPRGFMRENIIAGPTYEKRNVEFIAHAREDIPALLAEVAWLREQVRLHRNEPEEA